MKRLPLIGVFALLFGGFCVPSLAAQDSVEGDWVGGTNLFDNPVFVHVRFTPNSSASRDRVNFNATRQVARNARELKQRRPPDS